MQMHTFHAPALTRRRLFLLLAACSGSMAGAQTGAGWSAIESRARGQTVYFNAWAGSERINAYLQWVGAELLARHGIKRGAVANPGQRQSKHQTEQQRRPGQAGT